MNLKFVTEIISQWEWLNKELISQQSIDSNISTISNIAGNLSTNISHFPEFVDRKEIRNPQNPISKEQEPFQIIVDTADTIKHKTLHNSDRQSYLSVSSMFEYKEKDKFRFIRNKITVEHNKFGKFDFMEVSKNAIIYLIKELNMGIIWISNILEAPINFIDSVSLLTHFKYQIILSEVKLEIFKRDETNMLVPFDPPSWVFELKGNIKMDQTNYADLIINLIQNSIEPNEQIFKNRSYPLGENGTFVADVTIVNTQNETESPTVIKIIGDEEIILSSVEELQSIACQLKFERIILFSKNEFPREIRENVYLNLDKINLITIDTPLAFNIPMRFFNIQYLHSNIIIKKIYSFSPWVMQDDAELFTELKGKPLKDLGNNFTFDKKNFMSISGVCSQLVPSGKKELEGSNKVEIKPTDNTNIFFKLDEKLIKIGLIAEFEWKIETKNIRAAILTFVKNESGISIWNLWIYFHLKDKLVETKFPVIKYGATSALQILNA